MKITELTPTQHRLLVLLERHQGKAVSKAVIFGYLTGQEWERLTKRRRDLEASAIRRHVHELRKAGIRIRSISAYGYLLES